MKRNDIGDSYLLWLLERVPAARRALGPLLASRFLIVSQYDGDRTRRQSLEMPGRYRFHSTRPAPWKRVSVASSVDRQSKGGVNFRRTTRRCFSVRLSRSEKAWEDRPGRAMRHPLIPRHSTQVRNSRRALSRGAAFDLRCCSCQATSSITRPVPLNEIASPARLPSNSA